MIEQFARALRLSDLSDNTIASYCKAVEYFHRQYGEITKKNLLSYKGWLVENYKAKTVNLRLQALNRYLDFIKKPNLKMRFIKVQQENFLENVISDADYRFFCRKLKSENRLNWYFVVRYLCATGARISELLQIKVEHVEAGYLDHFFLFSLVRSFMTGFFVLNPFMADSQGFTAPYPARQRPERIRHSPAERVCFA